LLVLLLTLPAAPTGTCRAATPADEILRFVPPDVAFCFVARDLRGHGQALAESPFVAGLRKSAVGESIAHSDDFGRLTKLQEQLQKHLGVDWERLRDDIFGDAVAFAYRPGPSGQPEDEEGLILIRARSAKPLADLVDRLNEAQKASGEVKEIEERSHHGLAYFRRDERDKPASYYFLRGPVLLLASREPMLLRALDLEAATPAEVEPSTAKEFRLLGADRAVLSVWVNPRAFDAGLARAARAATAEAAGLRTFERYWRALDAAGCFLQLDKDAALSVTVRCRPEQLPPAARRLFAEAARPSDLWQAFPDTALVAGAVRIDAAALVEAVNQFVPADGRPAMTGELNRALGPPLGKDFVREVLPCIGPDFGFCLYPPPAGDRGWCPQGFAAVRVSPGDPAAPVDRALLAGLHSLAVFAVMAHNAKDPDHPLSLKTVTQDKNEVTYLSGEGVFPPGYEPAIGLRRGYLVAATSPSMLSRFAPAPAPSPAPGEAVPLLRVGLKEWREYLRAWRDALAIVLAENERVKPADARRKLDTALGTLDLFDRLELNQQSVPGRATLTLRLRPALALRK
jgi:hypothetical protein